MFKMYAPSATETFGQCQILWALRQSGWHTDDIGYPNVAMSVGTGIHKVAEIVHDTHQAGLLKGNEAQVGLDAVEAGVEEGLAGIRRLIEAGACPIERLEDWRDRITDQVTRGGKAYAAGFLKHFMPSWRVVSTEEAYGANRGQGAYTGRLDLLFEDDNGVALADVKTKQPFKVPYYRDMFINGFKFNWQMYSYMHMVRLHTGELPQNFYLIMIELKQRPIVEFHKFKTDERFYQRWLHAANERWAKMQAIENGEAIPALNDNHFFYGRDCPYKRACLELDLDEQAMKNNGYINIGD